MTGTLIFALCLKAAPIPLQANGYWHVHGVSQDPLSVDNVDFNCTEGLFDDGFSACTLGVNFSISIPQAYAPYLTNYVDITCIGEIAYKTLEGLFEKTVRKNARKSVYLYGGYVSEHIQIDVNFIHEFEPVVHARPTDLHCAPE